MQSSRSANKAKVCRYYQQGYCKFGQHCKYMHDNPKQQTDKICKYYEQGYCRLEKYCNFKHEIKNLPNECEESKKGLCFKHRCRYKHINPPKVFNYECIKYFYKDKYERSLCTKDFKYFYIIKTSGFSIWTSIDNK